MRNYWDAAIMARVRIWQIMPLAGPHRVVALIALGLALGALPLVFMIATSQMIGHVPDAVAGGLGSPAWDEVVRLFLIAAAAFVSSQILAPIQQMLGLAVQRSVDGHIRDQAVAAVTGSVGISALEDGEVLATFSEARMRFENNWHTPGEQLAHARQCCGGHAVPVRALHATHRVAGRGVDSPGPLGRVAHGSGHLGAGSHDELVALGGIYADLYALQAKQYA